MARDHWYGPRFSRDAFELVEREALRAWRAAVAAASDGTIDELLTRLAGVLASETPTGLDVQEHSAALDSAPVEGWVFHGGLEFGYGVLGFDEQGAPAIGWFWPHELTPEVCAFSNHRYTLAIVAGWVVFSLRDARLRDELLDRVEADCGSHEPDMRFDSWLATVRTAAQEAAFECPELWTSLPGDWRALEPTAQQAAVLVRIAALPAEPRAARIGALADALLSAGPPRLLQQSTPTSITGAVRFGAAAEVWVDHRPRAFGPPSAARHRATVLRVPGTGVSEGLRRAPSRALIRELVARDRSLIAVLSGWRMDGPPTL